MKKVFFFLSFLLLSFPLFSQERDISAWKAENGKYGFRTWQGLWAVKPIYDEVLEFYAQPYTWVRVGQLWGVINRKGNYVIHCKYEKLMNSFDVENFVCVQKDKKFGCVDTRKAKEIIPCVYDVPFSFEEIEGVGFMARLVKDKKVGLLDSTGSEVVPCVYDNRGDNTFQYHPESNNFFVKQGGKLGIISLTGKVLVPCEFDKLEIVMNKDQTFFAYTQKGKKYGAYHSKNQEIAACVYDVYFEFDKDGLAIVRKNKKYVVLSQEGKELTDFVKHSYEIDSLVEEIRSRLVVPQK
jgi:hypothetical protein